MKKNRFFMPVVLIFLLLLACLNPVRDNIYDPNNPNKAYISGAVTNRFANNSPAKNATVLLTRAGDTLSSTVATDSNGRYILNRVDPGIYTIEAKAGYYLTDEFSESLSAGKIIDNADLSLYKAFYDFEKETLGVHTPGGFDTVAGTWSVIDEPGQGHEYKGTTPGTGLAIATNNEFVTDFFFKTMLKVDPSSDTSFVAGIVFRYQGVQNYYSVFFGLHKIDLIKASTTSWTVIGAQSHQFSRDTWYNLSVDCHGDHIQVFLDNDSVPVFNVHDSGFANGKTGLYVESLAATRFDNYYLEKY
jgi:hypothetical protein